MGRQLRRSIGTLLILLLFLWCSGVAQTPARPTGTLTVFAAASLTEPFTEIGKRLGGYLPWIEDHL